MRKKEPRDLLEGTLGRWFTYLRARAEISEEVR
jgi:hypothetical protein